MNNGPITEPLWGTRESVLAKAEELDWRLVTYLQLAGHARAELDPTINELLTLASSLCLQTKRLLRV